MIKPTSLAYIFLAAALAACDAPASSATAQALTDTTVLPATGWGDSGVTWTSSSDGSVSWCCTNWYVPLPLGVGESVGSISTTVRDNGTANGFGSSSNNVIVVLLSQTSSGSTVLGSVSTDGSGNLQSKTLTLASPHTVASGESLVVKAVALAGGAFPGPASHPSLIEAITIPPAPHVLTLPIHGSAFAVAGSDVVYSQQGVRSSSMNGVASLPLPIGSTIVAVRVDINDDPSPTRMTAVLSRLQKTGTVTVLAQTPASAGSGTTQELSVSGLNVQMLLGSSYSVAVADTLGSAPTSIFMAEVDYVPPTM